MREDNSQNSQPRPRLARGARLACGALALATLAGVSGAGAAAATGPTAAARSARAPARLPSSMASVGDSITRAFDIDPLRLLRDSPQFSWTTGDDPSVDSQYRRLLAVDPGIAGHAFNDARTGARMSALDGQLATAASQRADYVTVLMGANDVCTRTAAEMTPTDTFAAQFNQALSHFMSADPHAEVFVSSIPNVRQLWSALHHNMAARATWKLFGICQSMLSDENTDEDRAAVDRQERADNAALADVCARYERCQWDGLAVYDYRFSSAEVSIGDFFHPSKRGQNTLAELTWRAGYLRAHG